MAIRHRRSSACWLAACAPLICSATTSVFANTPGGGNETGPDVVLTDNGSTVILDNGTVSATIVKTSARVASLLYQGFEMVATDRQIYFSMDGGASYEQPSNCVYSVKTETPDIVDISLKHFYTTQPHKFDIDIHYVLRRGNSGLYVYAVLDHPSSYGATSVSEWRMVWWMPHDSTSFLMERIYVDALRNWEMPSVYDLSQAESTSIAEIIKLTTGVRAGKYDSKYEYSVGYADVGTYGHASNVNNLGAWLVFGSQEFFNDGPTKQDLAPASGIIHVHFGRNHYNGSSISVDAGESWSKIFGPYLLYLNSEPRGGDALWADAQAQVSAEVGAWPYSWLTDSDLYPLAAERGSVSGRFLVSDALKPGLTGAGAWVGVAQPDPGGNWQFDAKHYQYWVKTDLDGSFTIPNVRPGVYALYAFANGAVGEYSQSDLSVEAGQTTCLGDVAWTVFHPGNSIAWEIGIPDRNSTEFRHGSDYFEPFLFQQFATEFSGALEYTVGVSDWSTDWNFAQTQSIEAGTNWKWRINFNLDEVPDGDATLTLAFAGSDHAHIYVYVNDESTALTNFYPENGGGNALIREGSHAKYSLAYVTIPTSRLNVGANTITLVQGSTGHVMYDYLSLEMSRATFAVSSTARTTVEGEE
jgi:rhamnogalacturonan endolyase